LRTISLPLICWVLFAGLMPGGAAAVEGLDRQTQQLWDRHWRVYAQRCAEFEGEYLCSPKYNKRYPSSTGLTVRQAEAKLSKKVRVGGSGIVTTRTVKMPIAEARAMALPIPKLKAGEYGQLASVEVIQVLSPTSMIVKDLYLIDPVVVTRDRRADRARARKARDSKAAEAELAYVYTRRDAVMKRQKDGKHRKVVLRLEGFSTDGLSEGERWAGPKGDGLAVLIVRPELYGSKRRANKQRLVAVSVKKVRWGLDEQAFIRLLETRGLDPKSFVAIVMEKMAEDDPQTARQRVFSSLLPGLVRDQPDNDKEGTKDDKKYEKKDTDNDEEDAS
jgi:hypothetical protein